MLGPPTLCVELYQGTQVSYIDRRTEFVTHPGALTKILDRRSQIVFAPECVVFGQMP